MLETLAAISFTVLGVMGLFWHWTGQELHDFMDAIDRWEASDKSN